MLRQLGNLIEKRPWLVVMVILLVTAGFASLIPSLEMKTDFSDFMPEEEHVEAFMKVFSYYGETQQVILLQLESPASQNMLMPQALKEQQQVQAQLVKLPEIESVVSIITFLDQLCLLEFGTTLDNCSNEQIAEVVTDLFERPDVTDVQLFEQDDPNEPIDMNRRLRFLPGRSIDSIDIKNGFLNLDNETITFSIEVHDLSALSSFSSPVPLSNVVEWYVDFENLILPDEQLDIKYRIAAHIEPSKELWQIGKGVLPNVKSLFTLVKNRQVFNSYTKQAYLWVKLPEQSMYSPIVLDHANITFATEENRIDITVSREELAQFGIAFRFGSIELPAKLSNFQLGTRYYQTALGKRPWSRISLNVSFLEKRMEKLQTRPILGSLAHSILQRTTGMSFDDINQFFTASNQSLVTLPDQLALKDIDATWTIADTTSSDAVSTAVLFLRPVLFDELQVNAEGFLSKEYQQTKRARASLMVLSINSTFDYDKSVGINTYVLSVINDLDEKSTFLDIKATGEGVISTELNKVTMEANQIIAPSIFLIIIFIVFISFRKVSYVFLPMLSLIISTIWLFGTMVLFGIEFNVIAVALIPIVLGLGIDYSVHLFHNYQVERDLGKTPAEAIKLSISEVGTAMFLAMITTLIAFLSFLTAAVPPLRDFGLLLGLGVLYTFITSITLLASLRYILDRKEKKAKNKKQYKLPVTMIMGKLATAVLSHQKIILVLTVLVSLFLAAGATQIKVGFDLYEFLPEGNETLELYGQIAEEFPFASQDQEYILIEGKVATVAALEGMRKTHLNLEDDTYVSKNTDGSTKATSIYTLIQQAILLNRSLITTFNIDERTGIPQTDQEVEALYDYLYVDINYDSIDMDVAMISSLNVNEVSVQVPTVLLRNNSRYESAVIRIYIDPRLQTRNGEANEGLSVLAREIEEDIEEYGDATAIATGNYIMTLTITDSLSESQLLSTGISIVLAALVLIIVYRNPGLGLIAIIPVGIAMVWILGTMYFLGYSLNVMTITVTSITIGIGIDYAIHATERFRFIADRTGDIAKAVSETISRTGGALFIAALTTTFGFGILVFAPMPPEQQFGVIMATTIVFSFLLSVIVLPLVLYQWAIWRKKRKGYIISPKKYKNEGKENLQ
ncbi:MAG: MMPL family transporter [Candidatus Thermoplasmatota archaeon]|nr:MMPL family transporter [Candidatus Thermoplasmatota archaeon]